MKTRADWLELEGVLFLLASFPALFTPLPAPLPKSKLSKTEYVLFMLFIIHVIPLSERPSEDPYGHKMKSKFLSMHTQPTKIRRLDFSNLYSPQVLYMPYIPDLWNCLPCTFLPPWICIRCSPYLEYPAPLCFLRKLLFILWPFLLSIHRMHKPH